MMMVMMGVPSIIKKNKAEGVAVATRQATWKLVAGNLVTW